MSNSGLVLCVYYTATRLSESSNESSGNDQLSSSQEILFTPATFSFLYFSLSLSLSFL